ncbi:hypothetical protein PROFUN_10165 [Planoprotostelium fungivorum]|uniref:Acyl-coenzyme A thioesterase THEM4 n=1 Tax=Planoprotostelium fungivorum TaxID=1890364 RepID=A0A2P6NEK6_9EUKA|nr:hypothetical protein PROFUN_10165 [Planoprotostelium fungivorum]
MSWPLLKAVGITAVAVTAVGILTATFASSIGVRDHFPPLCDLTREKVVKDTRDHQVESTSQIKRKIKPPSAPPEGFRWFYHQTLGVYMLTPTRWRTNSKVSPPTIDVSPKPTDAESASNVRFTLFSLSTDMDRVRSKLREKLETSGMTIEKDWEECNECILLPIYKQCKMKYHSPSSTYQAITVENNMTKASKDQFDSMMTEYGSQIIKLLRAHLVDCKMNFGGHMNSLRESRRTAEERSPIFHWFAQSGDLGLRKVIFRISGHLIIRRDHEKMTLQGTREELIAKNIEEHSWFKELMDDPEAITLQRRADLPCKGYVVGDDRIFLVKRLYQKEQKIIGLCQFGNNVEGPPGGVHGGCTASVFDTFFGYLSFHVAAPKIAVTVNLNINYRKFVPLNSTRKIIVEVDRIEGRKVN